VTDLESLRLMKKFLPLIIFGLGVIVLALVYFLVVVPAKNKPATNFQDESALMDIALNDRPFTSLTPTDDGHFINMKIDKIKIPAVTMDYELLYDLPDGRTQGVPGTITLNGQTMIERKMLLGSESSGKFRYDEGVKEGTLTLRFRNDKAKLIAKFITKFALLSNTKTLSSVDENFKATLTKLPKGFQVVMETFGVPADAPGEVKLGPFGIFASSGPLVGSVDITGYKISRYNGSSWVSDFDAGIFVGTAQ